MMKMTNVGTPLFMSPEQLLESITGQPSDIWSLGCILYQMVTGDYPFNAMSIYELMANIRSQSYPPVSESYSKELRDLIFYMLEKDPEKRIPIHEISQYPLIQRYKQKSTKSSFSKLHPLSKIDLPILEDYQDESLKEIASAFHFPYDVSHPEYGIFGFLSKIPISAFAEEIVTKNLSNGNFLLFQFLSSASQSFALKAKSAESYFQFTFNPNKFFLKQFLSSHLRNIFRYFFL